ncbi:MAG: sugar phosphate nucleotidyltransferase, partial [Patescibacteria group bacterium]
MKNIDPNNVVVALMTGGESSRFKEVEGSGNTHKNSFFLPNGDTMIEMTVRMYRDAGFKNFVALVYHKAQTIVDILGNGSKYGVSINYCHDPDHPVGKGGAVRNALDKGFIPQDKYLIVHNPDDLILEFPEIFPRYILEKHQEGEKRGCIATVAIVKETPYAYTGMKIEDGIVKEIEMYPMVKIPAHVGVTVFSPQTYQLFRDTFDLSKKTDFEKVLFPILARDKKLYSASIPTKSW